MYDSLKHGVLGVSSIGTVEVVHQLPMDEVVKLTIQTLVGILTIIQILNEHRKSKRK